MRFATLYAVAVILFTSTVSAHAYLDPGTGSILLQGAIGAIASGLFFVKLYWTKVRTVLGLIPALPTDTDHHRDEAR